MQVCLLIRRRHDLPFPRRSADVLYRSEASTSRKPKSEERMSRQTLPVPDTVEQLLDIEPRSIPPRNVDHSSDPLPNMRCNNDKDVHGLNSAALLHPLVIPRSNNRMREFRAISLPDIIQQPIAARLVQPFPLIPRLFTGPDEQMIVLDWRPLQHPSVRNCPMSKALADFLQRDIIGEPPGKRRPMVMAFLSTIVETLPFRCSSFRL